MPRSAQPLPTTSATPFPSEILAAEELAHGAALDALRAERDAWRQQAGVLAALLQSSERSWSMRLTAPLRGLRRLLWPRGFDIRALLPWQQLEATEDGGWRSTGDDPQFIVPCQLPAGWARIRLRMTSSVRGRWELYADTGHGFRMIDCIERADIGNEAELNFHVRFDAPVRAMRFDPLDRAGEFRIESLQVEPVPAPHALVRAIAAKVSLLRQHGLIGRCAIRGLGLLARGEIGVFWHKLFRGLQAPTIAGPDFANLNADYQVWRRQHRLTMPDRRQIANTVAAMADPPRLSVLLPVYNTPENWLRRAVDSVLQQLYPHWELCIADDGSTAPHVRRVLEAYAASEPRIRLEFLGGNRGISAASNAALALATGEYVALLDHDDELAEHALFRMAETVAADRGLDMVYSDEDKIDRDGRHVEPFFKPDWSPESFLGCMYTCHLGLYRTALVRDVGGFRGEFDGAQDYDLVLRLSERTTRIGHVPDVLYHWRKLPESTASRVDAKPLAAERGRRALQEHLERTGQQGRVEPGALPGLHRVRFAITGRSAKGDRHLYLAGSGRPDKGACPLLPRVSIIVPSACRPTIIDGKTTYHIVRCVESIHRKSSYDNYDILLVHGRDDVSPELAAELERLRVNRLACDGEFNWSAAMNQGAAAAWGDHFLFLNDDTEVLSADWIESLLEFSQQPEIGAVGAKLVFPTGKLQHAGVVVAGCTPRHAFYRFPGCFPGYFSNNLMHRNVAAVTGACLMTRAEVFQGLGGFCQEMPLNYNDIDYCLRVVTGGRRVVLTPYAQLIHHEACTKAGTFEAELDAFRARWQKRWSRDRYYNPNLSSHFGDYRLDLGQEAR